MADKALLLGINNYRSVSRLRGCENDVKSMNAVLRQVFGFAPANIRQFTNADVTKREVNKQLKWLYQDAKSGDRVVLHFSGHGSYIDDKSGDEDDNRDELLCLVDMDFKNAGSYLLDDELAAFTKLKPDGVELLISLDNCHSGTGTRLVSTSGERGLSAAPPARVDFRVTEERAALSGSAGALSADSDQHLVLARFIDPPPDVVERIGASREVKRAAKPKMNHVLLAACKDTQTAADAFIDGDYHGAFTYYLCDQLRRLGQRVDRAQLIAAVRHEIDTNRFSQVPQLEAPRLKGTLFGARSTDESDESEEHDSSPDAPEATVPAQPDSAAPAPVGSGLVGSLADRIAALQAEVARLEQIVGLSRGIEARAPTAGKAIVYVHGINEHGAGFSNGWWGALAPHAPSLAPGQLNGNRFEVIWSDIVNRDLESAVSDENLNELKEQLADALMDRRGQTVGAEAPRDINEPGINERGITDDIQSFLGLPQIDDFLKYLLSDDVRRSVLARFTAVVRPLLAAGRTVEIVSHSWGTVVAYEGLRELEAAGLSGRVHNFFTAGSALSMSMIKRRLRPENRDGRMPTMVKGWTNVDAQGDLVGGGLRSLGYGITREFLEQVPTGCNRGWFGYGLSCAHASYFKKENLTVNREIFGNLIERS